MIFKLWHKLVLTIVLITAIVLSLALYLSNQSVKKGFLAYINQVEAIRIDSLAKNLVKGYQDNKNDNWEFVRHNKGLWHRYNQRSNSPLAVKREQSDVSLPLLHDLANRAGDDGKHPKFSNRPPPRHRPPPRFDSSFDHQGFRGDGFSPPPPRAKGGKRRHPPGGRSAPPRNLVLLDNNKQFVIGGRKPTHSSDSIVRPLMLDDKVIGYIQFEPFTKITKDLDQKFITHQTKAFTKIAFLALGVVLIGTWFLANYLRKRINVIGSHASRLTFGNYGAYQSDSSPDELGQLSRKLSFLGDTLESNLLSRQRWISDISHELRTPVAVLQGEIEAIQDGVRKMTPEAIDSLHHEILRLSRLVNDLHELSMSDMGALSYNKESINMVELIEGVVISHQAQFDEKQISVNIESSKDTLWMQGDWQRLEQLFSNLANNSYHYTSTSGSLNIQIKQAKSKTVIEWSDSSPDVTDEELAKLFDRLFRVDTSRGRNTGGSGLGLAICKNIVEAHDGEIQAGHSDLGGVVFTIIFP